jgi:hypothetical protein
MNAGVSPEKIDASSQNTGASPLGIQATPIFCDVHPVDSVVLFFNR